jgi:hypothetical protein
MMKSSSKFVYYCVGKKNCPKQKLPKKFAPSEHTALDP